jgi:hypothetical protein
MDRGRELFRLTVYGTPAGAGSKTAEVITHKGYGRVGAALGKKLAQLGIIPPGRLPVMKDGRYVLLYRHQSKKTEPWMEAVERDAQVGWRGAAAIDGAIWVEIDCFETRPTAHFRADGSLRPRRPTAAHRVCR